MTLYDVINDQRAGFATKVHFSIMYQNIYLNNLFFL